MLLWMEYTPGSPPGVQLSRWLTEDPLPHPHLFHLVVLHPSDSQAQVILPPNGHFAMSGVIFGCQNWGKVVLACRMC